MSFTRPIDKHEAEKIEASNGAVPPDWADSLTRASRAVRKLEDAFPRADEAQTVAALSELEKSVAGFKSFLLFRGVTT